MRKSRTPSKKVSAHSLAQKAVTLKTSIEFKLESFIKDPKIEKSLEDISRLFKRIEDSKEKAEYLQEFQKGEKTLSSLIEKLKHHQELLPKYEERLKEILDKRSLLKMPDKDDQNFEEDKKKIEEAVNYIEATFKIIKDKLNYLSEKMAVLRKQQASLQGELEQFSLLDSMAGCEKEAKKLGEKLELVCQSSAALASKPAYLTEATKTGIKTFIPSFGVSLGKFKDLFTAANDHLGPLLTRAVAPPSAASASLAAPRTELPIAAAANSSLISGERPVVAMSAAAQAIIISGPASGSIRSEGAAGAVEVRPVSGEEAANEAVSPRARIG